MSIEIIKLFNLGYSTRRIALKLNIKNSDVTDITKNLTLNKLDFSNKDIPDLINLYQDGVSAKSLAFIYQIGKRKVFKILKENNIYKRTADEGKRAIDWNFHAFDEINTEETAYWLGFFYADAYNCQDYNKFQLNLAIQDHDQLIKLTKFINFPESKISTYTVESNGVTRYYKSLILYSKHLCETLTKHGCPQAKSFIIDFPHWLSKDLIQHFIRGLFDGDGCITFREKQREWRFCIASTKEIVSSIKNILDNELNTNMQLRYISDTNNNTWLIECSGNFQIFKICNYMYNNANIYLERKFQKYQQVIDFQRNKKVFNSQEQIEVLSKFFNKDIICLKK